MRQRLIVIFLTVTAVVPAAAFLSSSHTVVVRRRRRRPPSDLSVIAGLFGGRGGAKIPKSTKERCVNPIQKISDAWSAKNGSDSSFHTCADDYDCCHEQRRSSRPSRAGGRGESQRQEFPIDRMRISGTVGSQQTRGRIPPIGATSRRGQCGHGRDVVSGVIHADRGSPGVFGHVGFGAGAIVATGSKRLQRSRPLPQGRRAHNIGQKPVCPGGTDGTGLSDRQGTVIQRSDGGPCQWIRQGAWFVRVFLRDFCFSDHVTRTNDTHSDLTNHRI